MISHFLTADTVYKAVGMKEIGAIYLAGGTIINSLNAKVTADALVSIRNIHDLKVTESHDGKVYIGSGETFQGALDNPVVPSYIKEALRFMGSRTKRNMATIGGNIAARRSDSYLIATLIAADAYLVMLNNERKPYTVSVAEYVADKSKESDLIISVAVPAEVSFAASKRYANTVESHSRLVVSLVKKNDACHVALAVTEVGIVDASALSEAVTANADLSEEELTAIVEKAGWITEDSLLYGSAAYRNYLIVVTVKRMLDDMKKGGQA